MAHHAPHEHLAPGEIAKPNTGWIWKTFWVLVGITAIEFAITFALPGDNFKTLRNTMLISLTILKAFFIVGEFMHLKQEVKSLIWTILIPMVLLVWLLMALITEGAYDGQAVQSAFN